jgi:hypothetical protein
MVKLPPSRIHPSHPFIHEGINCCGKSTEKHTAVFICFATKAIHLEVTDLTAAAFIAPLIRFMVRCDKCACVTSFIRAHQEMDLTRLFQSKLH